MEYNEPSVKIHEDADFIIVTTKTIQKISWREDASNQKHKFIFRLDPKQLKQIKARPKSNKKWLLVLRSKNL